MKKPVIRSNEGGHENLLKIALLLIVLIAVGFTIGKIRFGFSLEEFLYKGSTEYSEYLEHKHAFQTGQEERMILMVLYNQEGIYKQRFLEKVDELTKFIEKIPAIAKVYSLTNTHLIRIVDGSLEAIPLIHIDHPAGYKEDSLRIINAPDLSEFMLSTSGKSLAIAAYYKEETTLKEKLLDTLESKIAQFKFDRTVISGMAKTENEFIQEINHNFIQFTLISSLVSAVILLFSLGSIISTLVALLIIAVPVVLILQIILMYENHINIIQTLSIPIIASLSLSHLIHLTNSYKNKLQSGSKYNDAYKEALKSTYPAMFLTTLTTAIGYFGLVTIDIIPIRNFGWITGLVSFISIFLVMDILKLFKKEMGNTSKNVSGRSNADLSAFMGKILIKVLRFRSLILLIFVILAVLMTAAMSKISLEGSLMDELPKEHRLKKDYEFMEREFCGIRDFEMVLSASDSAMGFINPAALQKIEKMETYLRDSLGACMLISPVLMIKAANRSYHGGHPDQFTLPKSEELLAQYVQSITQTQFADEWYSHVLQSGHKIRISGRLPELTIMQFENLESKLYDYYQKQNLQLDFQYQLTGKSFIFDNMAKYLGQNLFLSLAVTLILIMAVLWWSWKSFNLAWIAMLSLSLCILLMGGLMGLLGIALKPDTALIFCLASGIAVDGTIHLINHWRELKHESRTNNLRIILRVYQNMGRTILMHSLIMLSGFFCLLFSSLPGAFNIGLLVSACLLFAYLINMTLLPILLLHKSK